MVGVVWEEMLTVAMELVMAPNALVITTSYEPACDLKTFANAETSAFKLFTKGFALNIFADEVLDTVRFADIIDGDDIRMVEGGRSAGF